MPVFFVPWCLSPQAFMPVGSCLSVSFLSATVVSAHASRVVVHLSLMVAAGFALGVVVAEVPGDGELHTAAAPPVELLAREGV